MTKYSHSHSPTTRRQYLEADIVESIEGDCVVELDGGLRAGGPSTPALLDAEVVEPSSQATSIEDTFAYKHVAAMVTPRAIASPLHRSSPTSGAWPLVTTHSPKPRSFDGAGYFRNEPVTYARVAPTPTIRIDSFSRSRREGDEDIFTIEEEGADDGNDDSSIVTQMLYQKDKRDNVVASRRTTDDGAEEEEETHDGADDDLAMLN